MDGLTIEVWWLGYNSTRCTPRNTVWLESLVTCSGRTLPGGQI
jgi:hypothetical protein